MTNDRKGWLLLVALMGMRDALDHMHHVALVLDRKPIPCDVDMYSGWCATHQQLEG